MSSEQTKNLKPDELTKIREHVKTMNDEMLIKFRNGFQPDTMGFDGEEGLVDE